MSDEQYVAFLKALRDHFTKPIYHYTTAKGFKGIVDSSEIWLTNTAFVNDTSECKAFWDSAAQDLLTDERLSNMAVSRELSSRLKDQSRADTVYVASFSSVENSLQQYRAYGGFCIGLDPWRMLKRPYNLYQCVYDKSDIIDWVCSKAKLAEWNGGIREEVDGLFAAEHLVFAAAAKYKNEAYRDENEIRMIAVSGLAQDSDVSAPSIVRAIHADDPPIHFRDLPSYGIPIPYVKFFISDEEFGESPEEDTREETMLQMKRRRQKEEERMSRELLPITGIWIGPMAHQEEVRLASEIMLREKGYENVPVIASEIPYRGV